jgi:hypothetical protein
VETNLLEEDRVPSYASALRRAKVDDVEVVAIINTGAASSMINRGLLEDIRNVSQASH